MKLIGDDFDLEAIRHWYEEEARHHDQFVGGRVDEQWSIYELFNRRYVFDGFFQPTPSSRVLSFGCAEGVDMMRVWQRHRFRLYGLDASDELLAEFRRRFPDAGYAKATVSGQIEFADDAFDYVIALGVLHHVPNVTFVLKEMHRVLKAGSTLIVREPMSSMGTAGRPRPARLSPNERGIPISWMCDRLSRIGFAIRLIRRAYYAPLMHILKAFPALSRYPRAVYAADRLLCSLPYRQRYVRSAVLDKLAPGSAYYVATKELA